MKRVETPEEHYKKMSETKVEKLILKLSVPTIISCLVTQFYNMADAAFVGELGTSQSGAIGVVFSFMAILQAFAFMFGQGSGSISGRLIGKRDNASANKFASTAFFSSIFTGLLFLIFGFIFLGDIVVILGSTPTIEPYAKAYISYILVAAPFMMPSLVMNNLLRYEGKASLGMWGLLTGAILNTGLDPLLIYGLDMGIRGAGLSTAISQVASFLVLLFIFISGKTQIKISPMHFTRTPIDILTICTTGLPSCIRNGVTSLSHAMLNTCAGSFGDAAVSGMSIVSRVTMFVFSVVIGIGQGYQPVSSFSYGARKFDRLKRAYFFMFLLSQAAIFVIGLIVFIFAEPVVRLFRNDPEVIEVGVRALRLHLVGALFLPISVATEMTLQSTGQRIAASILSSLRSGVFFIPLLYILFNLRGLAGIQEAQPLAFVLTALPAIIISMWFFNNKIKREAASDENAQ